VERLILRVFKTASKDALNTVQNDRNKEDLK
jgi:hypothetical protein